MPEPRTPDIKLSHPALENARQAILADYLELRARRFENRTGAERHAQRGLKAVALAPALTVCRALLTEEHVHWTRLDTAQARRYGIRRDHRHADGRYCLDDFNDVRL